MRHILLSTEFQSTWGQKVKRPLEIAVGAYRALNFDLNLNYSEPESGGMLFYINSMGQRLYNWPAPNGYPDVAPYWLNSTMFIKAWRFVNRIVSIEDVNDDFYLDILSQTPAEMRTAVELVDYWSERVLGYLLPTEEREILIDFLASGFNENYELPIEQDDTNQRLRMVIATILLTPSAMNR